MIAVPKPILWDYREAPDDLLWRLQRIADFFPRYVGLQAPGASMLDALVLDAEPLAGLELRVEVDQADVSRLFAATARRWVRASLDEGR